MAEIRHLSFLCQILISIGRLCIFFLFWSIFFRSLRYGFIAGEHCDPATMDWTRKHLKVMKGEILLNNGTFVCPDSGTDLISNQLRSNVSFLKNYSFFLNLSGASFRPLVADWNLPCYHQHLRRPWTRPQPSGSLQWKASSRLWRTHSAPGRLGG